MDPLFDKKADRLSGEIIGAAIAVHRIMGPGLLERIYERCFPCERAAKTRGRTELLVFSGVPYRSGSSSIMQNCSEKTRGQTELLVFSGVPYGPARPRSCRTARRRPGVKKTRGQTELQKTRGQTELLVFSGSRIGPARPRSCRTARGLGHRASAMGESWSRVGKGRPAGSIELRVSPSPPL